MKFMHAAKHVCACRETLPLIGAKKAHRINIFVQNSSKLHEFTLILLTILCKMEERKKGFFHRRKLHEFYASWKKSAFFHNST